VAAHFETVLAGVYPHPDDANVSWPRLAGPRWRFMLFSFLRA